jgi:hypothetical protein
MKRKISDIIITILFCGFLGAMLLMFVLLPEQNFSEKEKRYLAQFPEVTWENIASGKLGEEVETYLADHIPGRDFLVGLAAYYDRYSGRQVTKDVYVAEGDRIVEAPVAWDEAAAQKNMNAINRFAETVGQKVDLMIVPSAGFCLEETVQGLKDPYNDTQIIRDIYAMAEDRVEGVDLVPAFNAVNDPGALYYRTDHHWTSRGAYAAYKAYMELQDRPYPAESDFTVTSHGGFYGSTYSRSGLWLTKSENVELWDTGAAFTVTNAETKEPHQGLFYEERLQELDKYTVYLDGNHSLVRIENPAAAGKGNLLVIRDSYANCLGTFLANSYESVTLVDLRYYRSPVSELVAQGDFTDILVCYSIGNFMTDANVIWLR